MVRTQIQLTERQAQALKKLAAEQDVSVAELIRRSIDALIESSDGRSEEERWARALSVSGMFRSGYSDLSVNHDKYLAEDFAS